ncbi:ABC transporter substrate-binding protein, partial [Desulfovibrio sp. OttesenSCG-928-M14]|nr:ABC transporter substrate-binding protein [Desulfovibrio sp. OttesenSCG-928-M14]
NMPNMNPAAKTFTENWVAAFPDKEPNVNAALGYTCYMMFMKAIQTAGGDDREAITKALAELKNFPAVTGMLSINATHDAEMPVGVIEIKDGKRLYLGEVQPEM